MAAISDQRAARSASEAAPATPGEPLRILHVVSHFPPDRVGGVGEVAAHIHRALVDRGHDSHVLTTGTTGTDPAVRRICDAPGASFTRRSAAFADWAAEFDLVHFHHGEALPLLARLRRRRPMTLLTLHVDNRSILRSTLPRPVDGQRIGSWREAARQGLFLGTAKVCLDMAAQRMADRSTFISRFGASEVAGSTAEVDVIHNGVVVPTEPEGSSDRSGDLLYVGTAGTRKRTALLPGLMRRVRRESPDTRLVVVGFDPADHPDLLASIESLGLEDAFDFVGAIRSDQLAPYYRSASALIVPSQYEGLPMVALEAMSHALPVVATRAGGIEEAVTDGVEGRLVEVDDVEALARAAVDVLADPTLAHEMGDAARTRIRLDFDVERQIDDYLELYQRMLES